MAEYIIGTYNDINDADFKERIIFSLDEENSRIDVVPEVYDEIKKAAAEKDIWKCYRKSDIGISNIVYSIIYEKWNPEKEDWDRETVYTATGDDQLVFPIIADWLTECLHTAPGYEEIGEMGAGNMSTVWTIKFSTWQEEDEEGNDITERCFAFFLSDSPYCGRGCRFELFEDEAGDFAELLMNLSFDLCKNNLHILEDRNISDI